MRIAMVSEHASPLAALGGVDAGGQNVHVAELAAGLARRGHEVVVHTRRDDPRRPSASRWRRLPGRRHVPGRAGRVLPKDELLPHMDRVRPTGWRRRGAEPPDVVHAHFWMCGLAALRRGRDLGLPVVQTFHALGTVKRRHQGAAGHQPGRGSTSRRRWWPRRSTHVVATCTDEVELSWAPGGRRSTWCPCGVDIGLFTRRAGRSLPRTGPPLLTVGRLVERKGVDTA